MGWPLHIRLLTNTMDISWQNPNWASDQSFIFIFLHRKKVPEVKEIQTKAFAGKGRILVMDDEALVRDIAAKLLSHIGYTVESAKDGAEAVKRYQMV